MSRIVLVLLLVMMKVISDDNIPKEGDASIETDDTPYETWLAAEGLMKLKESKENIR